jgi:hypothetical protein
MKEIFENYAGGMGKRERNRTLSELKEKKYSHLIFSLRHPFNIILEK